METPPSVPRGCEAADGCGEPRGCGARRNLSISAGETPLPSALMFAAGALGNLAALGLLLAAGRRRRSRREASSPFHSLALALVLTDLAGTCLLSPAVLAAYGWERSLVGLDGGRRRLCQAFAFAMSFFALATVGCLGAMALERGLALGAPYLYGRLRAGRGGRLLAALPALYAVDAAFCALPLMGFGRYVQYCPGTWCFIRMHDEEEDGEDGDGGALAFSLLYASVLLLLIAGVLLCNLSVMVNLVRMYRRGQAARPRRPAAPPGPRRPLSVSKEMEHLVLLSIMTLTFAVCSLPFTIRAFMNYFTPGGSSKEDLLAMRFLSVNSIIDPWVFIILRPSVLRLIRSILCCRTPFKSWMKEKQGSSVAKPTPMPEIDTGHQ